MSLRSGTILGVLLVFLSAQFHAEEPEIDHLVVDPAAGEVSVGASPAEGVYYLLKRSGDLEEPFASISMFLGSDIGKYTDEEGNFPDKAFFIVEQIPLDDPRDFDQDGFDDVFELRRAAFFNPVGADDPDADPDGNGLTRSQEYDIAQGPGTSITSSPADGETGVAVTRETILRFSAPLADEMDLTTDQFYATFGGERLAGRIEMAVNRQSATLFYDDPLPSSGRISVTLKTDGVADFFDRSLDGDENGQPGGDFSFTFDTLSTTTIANTAVCGERDGRCRFW